MSDALGGRALMLYDGLCGFCHGSAGWLARHDTRDRFRFAPQQSTLAAAALARHGIDRDAMLAHNSVYLILNYGLSNERLLERSDVQVHVLRLLGGPWRILGCVLRAVPKFIRDGAYSLFARNRFRWTERYEICGIPSPEVRLKFID